jgi:hypothetical protein
MYNGPPINFPYGSIVDVYNLVWSIDGSDIFVDYHCSDKLFINSCYVTKNVSQFHVLSLLKCNPNLFGHFFNPYIFQNLYEYDIPSSSCFSIDSFMHPSIINVVSFTFDFLFCPTYVNVFSSSDYIPYPTFIIVSTTSSFVFSPTSTNVCSTFDSIFYPTFICVSYPYDC